MKILDLDLDLFINEPAYWCEEGTRLSSNDYEPWSASTVRYFLEQQCGLSKKEPIPGKVVQHHHEAFYFWLDLIQKGNIQVPFDIYHADSHADLGLGDSGWVYLMGDYLHSSIKDRLVPEEGAKAMNAGNYLVFAIACHWVKTLTYIHHPKGGDDLLPYHFRNFDTSSNEIQLKKCDPIKLRKAIQAFDTEVNEVKFGVAGLEPIVPFKKVSSDSFKEKNNFDYIVLSLSPQFTPLEADGLIPIIKEYMIEI